MELASKTPGAHRLHYRFFDLPLSFPLSSMPLSEPTGDFKFGGIAALPKSTLEKLGTPLITPSVTQKLGHI